MFKTRPNRKAHTAFPPWHVQAQDAENKPAFPPWHDPGSLLVLTHQNPFPVVNLHRREPKCPRGNSSTIHTLHLWGSPPASPPPCHGKSKGEIQQKAFTVRLSKGVRTAANPKSSLGRFPGDTQFSKRILLCSQLR